MSEKVPADILTERLREQEAKARADAERGVFDGRTDFGAYSAFKTGHDASMIAAHAIASDERARVYAEQAVRFLRRRGLSLAGAGLDAGCAIGTVTAALRRAGAASVVGVELSRDAVEVARARYPDCSFACGPAEELDSIPDGSLNWVHAREFYAFTRTRDMDHQALYLRLFARKLRPGGFFLAYMKNEGGLADTFPAFGRAVAGLGYASAETAGSMPLRALALAGGALDATPLYAVAEALMSACAAATDAIPVWHLFRK